MKTCRVCKEEKPLSAFHPNKSCAQGVVGTCRDCTRGRIKGWYADNRKARQDTWRKTAQDRKRYWVDRFGDKCADCEQTYHQCVYQFHHVDGSKEANPSYIMRGPIEKAEAEMAKCVMLCANCHMIRHHGEENVST